MQESVRWGSEYFDRLGHRDEASLSPRSRSILVEYGTQAREVSFDSWYPAATRIYEVLEEDFLLNLAGFRQELLYGVSGENGSYWGRVLRPGVWLFATVPVEMYEPGPAGKGDADLLLQSFCEEIDELGKALARYGDRFGHLPVAPTWTLGILLGEWSDRLGVDGIWEAVWAWADAPTDPLRRYHACRALVENPQLIPDGMHCRLWDGSRGFSSPLELAIRTNRKTAVNGRLRPGTTLPPPPRIVCPGPGDRAACQPGVVGRSQRHGEPRPA